MYKVELRNKKINFVVTDDLIATITVGKVESKFKCRYENNVDVIENFAGFYDFMSNFITDIFDFESIMAFAPQSWAQAIAHRNDEHLGYK